MCLPSNLAGRFLELGQLPASVGPLQLHAPTGPPHRLRQRYRAYPKSFTSYGFPQYSGGDGAVEWRCDRRGKGTTGARSRLVSTRAAAWLAWTMWALSIGLTVLSLWLLIMNLSHPNVPVYLYWAEATLLAVGYSTVGAVAASHRPGNPVGWVLCSIGLSWGVAHSSSEYATYALLAAPGSLPAAEAAAWIYSWVWVPGLGFIVFLALLFPNGRLHSPRWRPFAWFSDLLVAAGTILAAISPGPGVGLSIRNPFGIESLPNLNEQLQALMFALYSSHQSLWLGGCITPEGYSASRSNG